MNCDGLITLDLSSFSTYNLTNTSFMFSGDGILSTIYISEYDEITRAGWTMENVVDSENMFRFCGSLNLINSITDKTYAYAGYSEELGAYGYLTFKE